MSRPVPTAALILLTTLSLNTAVPADAREYDGRYTADKLANARDNCEKYDWAKKIRAAAVTRAKPWLEKSDETLWAMVPGQDLPRTIDVTMDTKATNGPKRLGCLVCGDKIDIHGNYPYEPDFEKLPWKLTCPSCKTVFPTNDFAKYYASGIDEHGLFDPKKADRSLLYNTEHPDPKDPLHQFGVDDGFGYIDKNGRGHRFIGYYTWKYWRHLYDGIDALADAYVYTGDKNYAHKAAVLLDRIADVYPSMDWKPYADRGWYHSDGGSGVGKIEGRIWETGTVTNFADNYGKILPGTVDSPDLYAFLKKQSERYQLPHAKGTRELLVQNIDDGLVRTAAAAVMAGQVTGNEGMHQRTLATLAITLDTQPETTAWLDWLFQPAGGAVPGLIVGKLDRDGVSPEAGPGYALSWGVGFAEVAGLLADYPQYTKHNIYRDFPQFRATFTAAYRLCALGIATPNIGDTGSTGSVGRANVSPNFIATGYRYTRDPELAVAAYRANGNSANGLGRDIYSKDPDALSREIEQHGKQAGPRPAGSSLVSGYGLALLESGTAPTGTALSVYYGRSLFHGHQDHLNFDLLAFGKWLTPDHGYPEFATAWPHRQAVTLNTLSHNTVVVDQKPQDRIYGGHTRLFKKLPGLSVVQIDGGKDAYPQTQQYTRTMLLIDAPAQPNNPGQKSGISPSTTNTTPAPNTYAVDFFQVTGGKDHVYSFHGPPGPITPASLNLVPQKEGTYAGPDVPFKSDKGPTGYSWWYNVQRDNSPPAQFTLDWKTEPGYRGTTDTENTHLRFHSLTQLNDVALADADPPQNKPGNPRRLGYALLHRTGADNLSTTFASVIEPYQGHPFIKSVQRLDTPGNKDAIAIRIELADGSVDHVVFTPTAAQSAAPGRVHLPNGLTTTATLTHTRESNGKLQRATLIQGSDLTYKDATLKAQPAYTGKVLKMNEELAGGGWLVVDTPLPTDATLVGQSIHIANSNDRDATYTIRSLSREGNNTRIDCGPTSFVRDYAGDKTPIRNQPVAQDYSKGYLHDFEPGAPFTIPTHTPWPTEAR
jgi:hypothetical protein